MPVANRCEYFGGWKNVLFVFTSIFIAIIRNRVLKNIKTILFKFELGYFTFLIDALWSGQVMSFNEWKENQIRKAAQESIKVVKKKRSRRKRNRNKKSTVNLVK